MSSASAPLPDVAATLGRLLQRVPPAQRPLLVAGHALPWEEPERFAADLAGFVAGLRR